MKPILDNNCLFSIMNLYSASAYLFSSIRAEFLAPEFIKQELKKHKEECLIKSNLSEQEFEMRQIEIEESIEFFKESEYDVFLDKAITNLSDPKDSPYFALALSTNSEIWSNDVHLTKQSLVKVYSTKDLLEMFLKGKI